MYEKTVPGSPPQNGVAEHSNLTICSMARAMLIDANLHDFFWPFAVLTASHIKQRIPHSSLPPGITPFSLWFNRRPNLSYLRPFGTTCTARILANHPSKFQPRGETGRFLGYASDAKGYLIWVPNPNGTGGTVKVRRDVTFHDFPMPPPSPDPPVEHLRLWEDVHFPTVIQPTEHHLPLPPPTIVPPSASSLPYVTVLSLVPNKPKTEYCTHLYPIELEPSSVPLYHTTMRHPHKIQMSLFAPLSRTCRNPYLAHMRS